MIQRIQSLYLLGAGLLGVYFFINFLSELSARVFSPFDIVTACIHVFLIIFPFYIIFKFNNRKAQIKLTRILLIISLVKTILIMIAPWLILASVAGKVGMPDTIVLAPYLLAMIPPIIQLLLTFLALRAIKKDEEKVRSVDRLR